MKNFLKSITMQGGLVNLGMGLLMALAPLFGWQITSDDADAITKGVESIVLAGAGIVTTIGSIMTIVGRWRASTKLTLGSPPPGA